MLKKAPIPYILARHLQINADPDPAYHFNPDPDPTFLFVADQDSDPDTQHCIEIVI